MATEKQKTAARHNLERARQVQRDRARGKGVPRATQGLSTADKDRLADQEFAFPRERKEPLVDATHVRNAVSRFNQVEGVTDAERDQAWRRIEKAAAKFDVELSEKNWRELRERR